MHAEYVLLFPTYLFMTCLKGVSNINRKHVCMFCFLLLFSIMGGVDISVEYNDCHDFLVGPLHLLRRKKFIILKISLILFW